MKKCHNQCKEIERITDPLEGERITFVLAETHWESACSATHGRRLAAAYRDRALVQSLVISAA